MSEKHLEIKDGSVFMGTEEMENIIKMLIKGYRFRNSNLDPKSVVIPEIKIVDGVKIVYETGEVQSKPRAGRKGG